ncbi:MAG TPA: hypothetical protein ENH10_10635 [Bacteroidetes bacterium]|nr:hypothetical protein [Bacteroidota bacterium]HEX05589.1 hypothetical protein [Bacteroidota bacterium]
MKLLNRLNIPLSIAGIAIGAAIGIANDNIGLGVGLAIVFGASLGRLKRPSQRDDDANREE